MTLPGYDEWKTTPPNDDRCDYCGAVTSKKGWEPEQCTGECGKTWRDPDYERDLR